MKGLHAGKLPRLSHRARRKRGQASISNVQQRLQASCTGPCFRPPGRVLLPATCAFCFGVSARFVRETPHSRKDCDCISLLATAQKEQLAQKSLVQTRRIVVIQVIMNSKPKSSWQWVLRGCVDGGSRMGTPGQSNLAATMCHNLSVSSRTAVQ